MGKMDGPSRITLSFECGENSEEFVRLVADLYCNDWCPERIGLECSCNFNDRKPQPTERECRECWQNAIINQLVPVG